MRRTIPDYIKAADGKVTIDFTMVSLALFLIMFMVLEMTLMYFMIQSEQKAAQIGVRIAAVSDPMVTVSNSSGEPGLPITNRLVTGAINGTPCTNASSPCEGFTTQSCTGSDCAAPFLRMLARMQNFVSGLEAQHVTVSYGYEGLGYAGGPTIPSITVTIAGVPHQTGVFGRLLGATTVDMSRLPPVSATITGEDLSETY